MLDELLGKAQLRERIEELEEELASVREERDRLESRLEAESERRAEAQEARQEAEERINRLEDRIAGLEGELENATADEADLQVRGTEALRGERTAAVLDRLASFQTGPEGALTAAIGDVDGTDDLPAAVREAFGQRAVLVADAAPCVAVTDDAGLVSGALSPPVDPDPFAAWDDGFDLDRSWFLPDGEYALALVRADVFALGEYEGRERRSFRGFESDVKGDHSKGGFSQARFERRRDEQIENHLQRCREAIADRSAERLYVVGDRAVLGEFDADATATVDASGDPDEALESAFRSFWTTRLTLV